MTSAAETRILNSSQMKRNKFVFRERNVYSTLEYYERERNVTMFYNAPSSFQDVYLPSDIVSVKFLIFILFSGKWVKAENCITLLARLTEQRSLI